MIDNQNPEPPQKKENNEANPYEIGDYFDHQPQVQKINHLTSKHFTDKILMGIDTLIYMGTVDVSKKRKTVEELMDRAKVKQQQLKQFEAKAKKQRLQIELQYLRRQTSLTKSNSDEKMPQGKFILSKQQHKKMVAKLKKQREERQRAHSANVNKIQKKIQDEEQLEKLRKQQRLQSQLKLRREAIQQNLQKQRKRRQQYKTIELESKSRLKELQHHKFVYQQIQDKYQKSIVLPNLQEKKRKLKELRQYKSFNIEQIKEHQRSYMEQKQLHSSRKSQIKEDWHYQPPPKPQRLEMILEEETMKRMEKEQQKRRQKIERLNKQQNFIARLRETFIPRVDPNKELEIRERIEKSRTTVREQNKNAKEIGMSYLQHAKRHRKNLHKTIDEGPPEARPETERQTTHNTIPTVRQTSMGAKPKSTTNYLTTLKHKDEHYYERARRRHIQKLTKQEDLSEPERIKELKIQSEKLNQKIKQRQKEFKYSKDNKLQQDTLELLLSSIQAKIGIIQMSRQ